MIMLIVAAAVISWATAVALILAFNHGAAINRSAERISK